MLFLLRSHPDRRIGVGATALVTLLVGFAAPPPATAATPESPCTTYVDTRTGLHIPVPAGWERGEKDGKVFFFEPKGADRSSLIIQQMDAPKGDENAAVIVTGLLHQGLQQSESFQQVTILGRTQANGLDLYILSALNAGMKDTTAKEVFIQIDRGATVACLNLTIDTRFEETWSAYVGQLVMGIADGRSAPGPAAAAAPAPSLAEEKKVVLAGVVRQSFGTPAAGVKVTVTLVTSFDPLSGTVVGETKTDSRGRYSLPVTPGLPYLVHAGEPPERFNAGAGAAGRRFVDLAREPSPPELEITLSRKR